MAAKNKKAHFLRKPLFKSKKDRVFFGFLGGLGEYFEINSTIIRLLFIALTAFTGFAPGIIAYIIGALVVPEKNSR